MQADWPFLRSLFTQTFNLLGAVRNPGVFCLLKMWAKESLHVYGVQDDHSKKTAEELSYISRDEKEYLSLCPHLIRSGNITQSPPPPEKAIWPHLDSCTFFISCVSLNSLISNSKDSHNLPGSSILNHNHFPTVLTPLKSSLIFFFQNLPRFFTIVRFPPISIIHEDIQTVGNLKMWSQWFF